MKLDCDPTTAYAAILEGRYTGVIHRSDLDSDNPYNTYRHAGPPPGPIASPGWPAVEAALAPAETNYLYFVAKADGSGGHAFSASLSEHEAAVAHYRALVHHLGGAEAFQKAAGRAGLRPIAAGRRSAVLNGRRLRLNSRAFPLRLWKMRDSSLNSHGVG